jgi:hypothetical protein
LKYEPHAFDTTVLRRALERVIERNAQKHRPMSDLKEMYCGWGRHQGLEPRPARYKAEVEANHFSATAFVAVSVFIFTSAGTARTTNRRGGCDDLLLSDVHGNGVCQDDRTVQNIWAPAAG